MYLPITKQFIKYFPNQKLEQSASKKKNQTLNVVFVRTFTLEPDYDTKKSDHNSQNMSRCRFSLHSSHKYFCNIPEQQQTLQNIAPAKLINQVGGNR